MKKIAICFLSLLMLFSFVSCGDSDDTVPAGYKKASNDACCDYILYVPETWICGSGTSNFTTATVASGDTCNVSMASVEAVYAKSVADYWAEQKAEYESLFGTITVVEEGARASVGQGENKIGKAYRYVFTAKHGTEGKETDYKFMQVFMVRDNALSGSALYCFTYTATADHYDKHLEEVNGILTNFSFK